MLVDEYGRPPWPLMVVREYASKPVLTQFGDPSSSRVLLPRIEYGQVAARQHSLGAFEMAPNACRFACGSVFVRGKDGQKKKNAQ